MELRVEAVKLTMVALASWAYFAVTAGTVDLDPVFSSNVAMMLGFSTKLLGLAWRRNHSIVKAHVAFQGS